MNCISTLTIEDFGAHFGALFGRTAIDYACDNYACEFGAGLIGRREEWNS